MIFFFFPVNYDVLCGWKNNFGYLIKWGWRIVKKLWMIRALDGSKWKRCSFEFIFFISIVLILLLIFFFLLTLKKRIIFSCCLVSGNAERNEKKTKSWDLIRHESGLIGLIGVSCFDFEIIISILLFLL